MSPDFVWGDIIRIIIIIIIIRIIRNGTKTISLPNLRLGDLITRFSIASNR